MSALWILYEWVFLRDRGPVMEIDLINARIELLLQRDLLIVALLDLL